MTDPLTELTALSSALTRALTEPPERRWALVETVALALPRVVELLGRERREFSCGLCNAYGELRCWFHAADGGDLELLAMANAAAGRGQSADDPESAEAEVTARDAARGVGPRGAT